MLRGDRLQLRQPFSHGLALFVQLIYLPDDILPGIGFPGAAQRCDQPLDHPVVFLYLPLDLCDLRIVALPVAGDLLFGL